MLFQIPQRYRFSSKSQLLTVSLLGKMWLFQIPQRYRFSSKSQQRFSVDLLSNRLFQIPQRYRFSSKSQLKLSNSLVLVVVLDTTKVQIFKQITTVLALMVPRCMLFQIPQRYRFSSKSQQYMAYIKILLCCFRYHKGTDFQANHNSFQQMSLKFWGCFRYHKGTDFQANHNIINDDCSFSRLFQIPQRYRFSSKSQPLHHSQNLLEVVLDTTKVQIFKQITTVVVKHCHTSQVVLDTTKVQIFKQITTNRTGDNNSISLFQIPQRYRFSSKSQQGRMQVKNRLRCFRYHKGTDFQANHNCDKRGSYQRIVVLDTTKVQIFKQITTKVEYVFATKGLFQIPQRYRFSSKSQRSFTFISLPFRLFQIPQRYRFSSKSQPS